MRIQAQVHVHIYMRTIDLSIYLHAYTYLHIRMHIYLFICYLLIDIFCLFTHGYFELSIAHVYVCIFCKCLDHTHVCLDVDFESTYAQVRLHITSFFPPTCVHILIVLANIFCNGGLRVRWSVAMQQLWTLNACLWPCRGHEECPCPGCGLVLDGRDARLVHGWPRRCLHSNFRALAWPWRRFGPGRDICCNGVLWVLLRRWQVERWSVAMQQLWTFNACLWPLPGTRGVSLSGVWSRDIDGRAARP